MGIGTNHHTKRIRNLHTRYWLLMVNGLALAGLITYGLTVRGAQAATDTAVLHSMMDSDTTMAPSLLSPPEVR